MSVQYWYVVVLSALHELVLRKVSSVRVSIFGSNAKYDTATVTVSIVLSANIWMAPSYAFSHRYLRTPSGSLLTWGMNPAFQKRFVTVSGHL